MSCTPTGKARSAGESPSPGQTGTVHTGELNIRSEARDKRATATALVYPASEKQGEHASIRIRFLNSHFLVLQNKLWKDVNI